MDTPIDTEFTDKSGKPIHMNDVIHIQLSSYAKSKGSGPQRARVVKFGKRFVLVPEFATEYPHGGLRLTKQIAALSIIVDCRHLLR